MLVVGIIDDQRGMSPRAKLLTISVSSGQIRRFTGNDYVDDLNAGRVEPADRPPRLRRLDQRSPHALARGAIPEALAARRCRMER